MVPNQNSTIFPIILCGGSGTRLWPLSRKYHPKPFITMSNGDSLFRNTLERIKGLSDSQSPIIVTNEEHRFYVLDILEQAGMDANIFLEPAPRNTAPAICLAALSVLEKSPDALMLVTPSDHFFEDDARFCKCVEDSSEAAVQGNIVTFGIQPTRAETGYGYICVNENDEGICKKVIKFVEKPPKALAEKMFKSGNHYWNSGIFLLKASTFIKEIKKYSPDIYNICNEAWNKKECDNKFVRPDVNLFLTTPQDSIDYAIMEKTNLAYMTPLACSWNDMGSWESFYQASEPDNKGNVTIGDVVLEDVENSYLHSHGRLVTAIGVKDLAIIETNDALLVAPRNRCQDVKKIVNYLKEHNREEANLHPVVYRPWGSYERLSMGERFQVKRIIVKPGCSLSLQMHHHRSEHWVIVNGTAEITIGEKKKLYTENQSVYIPVGELHKLYNPGKIPLELIEVQSGSYLAEDDITRLEDSYGRK